MLEIVLKSLIIKILLFNFTCCQDIRCLIWVCLLTNIFVSPHVPQSARIECSSC